MLETDDARESRTGASNTQCPWHTQHVPKKHNKSLGCNCSQPSAWSSSGSRHKRVLPHRSATPLHQRSSRWPCTASARQWANWKQAPTRPYRGQGSGNDLHTKRLRWQGTCDRAKFMRCRLPRASPLTSFRSSAGCSAGRSVCNAIRQQRTTVVSYICWSRSYLHRCARGPPLCSSDAQHRCRSKDRCFRWLAGGTGGLGSDATRSHATSQYTATAVMTGSHL